MIKDPFIGHALANRTEEALASIPPEFRGEMARLDSTGDTKIIWDRRNPDEVAMARTTFETLRSKGYMGFRVNDKDASKGEQMRDFDPNAEKLIMVAALAGG